MSFSKLRSKLRGADSDAPIDVPIDKAIAVLGNERRRLAVRFADSRTGTFAFSELVEYIAKAQYGDAYDSDERKTVYVTMYQHHVDDLVAIGALQPIGEGGSHRYRGGAIAGELAGVLDDIEARLGGERL